LVLILATKHHGKATIHGVGATNKLVLLTQILDEATATEWNTVAVCMLLQADVDFLTSLAEILVTVKIKVLQKDACALKAVEAALVTVWTPSRHIAVL
jgi:hypothetical protein